MRSSVTPFGEGQRMLDLGEALRSRLHPKLAPVLDVLPQFSRYTVVSGLALILDFTVYLLLAASGMMVALAAAFGYACGLALHYLLSVRYVFDPRAANKAQTRLLAEFALSGFAGLAITALVIAVTVDLGGMPLLPAKVLAVGMSFLVVFALRRSVVFAGQGSV
jgi:putative flippase GtrA